MNENVIPVRQIYKCTKYKMYKIKKVVQGSIIKKLKIVHLYFCINYTLYICTQSRLFTMKIIFLLGIQKNIFQKLNYIVKI